jgi:hypothetical protein
VRSQSAIVRTNGAILRTNDAFVRTNGAYLRTNGAYLRTNGVAGSMAGVFVCAFAVNVRMPGADGRTGREKLCFHAENRPPQKPAAPPLLQTGASPLLRVVKGGPFRKTCLLFFIF